jgi:hypothetical protein
MRINPQRIDDDIQDALFALKTELIALTDRSAMAGKEGWFVIRQSRMTFHLARHCDFAGILLKV